MALINRMLKQAILIVERNLGAMHPIRAIGNNKQWIPLCTRHKKHGAFPNTHSAKSDPETAKLATTEMTKKINFEDDLFLNVSDLSCFILGLYEFIEFFFFSIAVPFTSKRIPFKFSRAKFFFCVR